MNRPWRLSKQVDVLERLANISLYAYLSITLIFIIADQIPRNEFILLTWLTVGIVVVAFIARWLSKALILNAGREGEDRLAAILDSLPKDRYHVFHDLELWVDGRRAQIDHVVLGDNGLFVIESKHLRGDIFGSDRDRFWTLVKRGRRGGYYKREFKNPAWQVTAQMLQLKRHLKAKYGINVWIEPVIVFTHPEARVKASTRIPIVKHRNIKRHIMSHRSRKAPKCHIGIVRALEELMSKQGFGQRKRKSDEI